MIKDTSYLLQDKCPACLHLFDMDNHSPMLICSEQHLCCLNCFNNKGKNTPFVVCPFCQELVLRDKIIKYRTFYYHRKKNQNKEKALKQKYERQKNRLIYIQLQKRQQQIVLLINSNYQSEKQVIKNLVEQAKALFTFNRLRQASSILQVIIERNPEIDEGQFLGIGSYQESTGYYQQTIYRWYQKNYKDKHLSLYDLLALCNITQQNYQIQSWYESLNKKYPQNFKIRYGLALTRLNANKMDSASKTFLQLFTHEKPFPRLYQMLSLISFKQQKYALALDYAQKSLQLQPSNLYSKLINAKCKLRQNKQEGRQMLLKIHQQQNEYATALYQLGESYYKDRSPLALTYWQKCITINSFYIEPQIALAKYELRIHQKPIKAIEILNSILKKEYLNKSQMKQCYLYLGLSFHFDQEWLKAILFLEKYFARGNYDQNLQASQCLADSYYFSHSYIQSLKLCQKCLPKCRDENSQFNQAFSVILIKCHHSLSWHQLTIQKAKQALSKYQVQLLHFILMKQYLAMGKLQQAQKQGDKCIQKNYQVGEVQIIKVQILQRKSLKYQALGLAINCMEKQQLTDYQLQKLQNFVVRVSAQVIQSKKQKLRKKRQSKQQLPQII